MAERVAIEVSPDGRSVIISGPEQALRAPAVWLFDNAEGACDPASGHRLHGVAALQDAMSLAEARIENGAIIARFKPAGHERRIPLDRLTESMVEAEPRSLWTSPHWIGQTPDVAFADYLSDDTSLAETLGRVARWGLAFLSGAGTEPETVARAVERFGFIRETNYGRLFDVREEVAPTHLAYTARGLEMHTDNPYRDPEPTLQLLHVIEAAAEGGESQFADGFGHAEALRAERPDRFLALATMRAPFAYRDPSGDVYAASAPVIELGPDGLLKAVRLNHRSLRPMPLGSGRTEGWYEAYLDFHARLQAPEAQLERKLTPGDMVIFDNRRVLHGRSAYRGAGGTRWLQGCYADSDALLARLRGLSSQARAPE